jgi:signal transduction histidine kinase
MIRAPDSAVAIPAVNFGGRSSAVARLQGRWLLLARGAWIGAALLVAVVVVAIFPIRYEGLLHTAGSGPPPAVFAGYEMGLFVLSVLVFEGVGALLVWHRSGARMALLSALALVTFPVYVAPPSRIDHLAPPWSWVGLGLSCTGIIALILAIYLVPDGRFVPHWTRWLILPYLPILAAHQFLSGTSWDYATGPGLLAFLGTMIGIGPALIVMLYRYLRISTPVQRRQTAWLIWGVVLAVSMVLLTELVVRLLPATLEHNLVARAAADTARVAAALLVPVAIAFAIARHRLWAIDLLLNRTLVYGMLTGIVIGLYVLVVGALSTALAGHGIVFVSLVATGLVALVFNPLRERLQASVNRLLYGERDDPYLLLSRLGQRLEETLTPDAVLPTLVEMVARALKLPFVAIALPSDRGMAVVASHGTPVPSPLVLPLVYRQELVGQLLVAPRPGSDSLSAADRRVFSDLTRQAAVAVHAGELTAKARRLSAELQQAHTRLVTLREEERRRLRRDLHDGLGPILASVTLQAENARDLLRSDPTEADAVLADLTTQAQTAIADIRRVVYDLRPPALDDLGLIDTVRAHADRLTGRDLSIRVEAQEKLPPLPAAVEVAAYRIIQEALTNVVRHAEATSCVVDLQIRDTELGEALMVTVTDDGAGLDVPWCDGVGLHSMRARAAELCGTCTITSHPGQGQGTRVTAVLPLECPDLDERVSETV